MGNNRLLSVYSYKQATPLSIAKQCCELAHVSATYIYTVYMPSDTVYKYLPVYNKCNSVPAVLNRALDIELARHYMEQIRLL